MTNLHTRPLLVGQDCYNISDQGSPTHQPMCPTKQAENRTENISQKKQSDLPLAT